MRRGELRLVAGGVYASKPRPALIVQSDLFEIDSVTVCPLTSDDTDLPLLRVPVPADATSGLERPSRLMVDKITTIRRENARERIGRLTPEQMAQFERLALVFLGFGA